MEALTATGAASAAEAAELALAYRVSAAVERRDGETHGHALRIGRGCGLLAAGIGLDPEEVELIRVAAPLHDIGTLGLADGILSKPGALSEQERAEMRRHTEIGRRMLEGSASAALRLGAVIAYTHHECWDGSGYPMALAGEEIPLPGRITAVIDAFDSMTHERPHRPARPAHEALAELGDLAGRQFDPALVGAFASLDNRDLLALAG